MSQPIVEQLREYWDNLPADLKQGMKDEGWPSFDDYVAYWKKQDAGNTLRQLRLIESNDADGRDSYYTIEFWNGEYWTYVKGSLTYNRDTAEEMFKRLSNNKSLPTKTVLREVSL